MTDRAYDDLTPAQQMTADCRAVERNLGLAERRQRQLERAARAAVAGDAPSLHFEHYPREVPKRGEIRVSDAATRLANALHLHLD
jgi:hypothetical protein